MSFSGSTWSLIVFGDWRALEVSESHKKKIKNKIKKKLSNKWNFFFSNMS